MSGDLLIGVDVGTYSSKGVLVALDGTIVQQHVVPHGISMPQPGFVEQDADGVWWADTVAILRALLSEPGTAERVAGVACSAIGPCVLALDEAGRPLHPGILYGVDTRASAQGQALEEEIGSATLFALSGMTLSSQATTPKMRWLREERPEVWAQTHTLTTASSYLVSRLSGEHVLDQHTAPHALGLYDPEAQAWTDRHREAILGDKGLDVLPRLGWSDERAGSVTPEAAALTGLRPGTPVAVGTVDALAEGLSAGVAEPGDLMVMYGSSVFFILVQDTSTPDERLWTLGGAYQGQLNLAGGMSTTGSLTRWLVDEFAQEVPTGQAYDLLFAQAADIAPGADGLLLLPYFAGERTPINDPQAKGVIAGLTLGHTRAHVFRAALEGVGYGIRQNIEAMRDLGADIRRVVAVGGGAKTPTWLQIVSDISGVPQEVPAVTVGASYGDAFLAGLAAGVLTREDLGTWVRPGVTIAPQAQNRERYDALYALYGQLYRDSRAVVHALGALR